MNKSDRHTLDEYFAKARTEPPVTTEEEISSRLDGGAPPGQQHLHRGGRLQHTLQDNTKRGNIMKGIVVAVIAGSLGSTAIYLHNQIPATSGGVLVPAPVAGLQRGIRPEPPAVPQAAAAAMAAPSGIVRPAYPGVGTKGARGITAAPVAKANVGKEGKGDNGGDPKKEGVSSTVHGLDSALSRQLGEEISKVAADYWVTKVNGYRVRIDRMLSASDLAELNRFRVRAGIMMKDIHESGSRKASISISMSSSSPNAGKKGEGDVDVQVEGDVDGAKIDSKGMNGQDMQGAMGMIQSLMSNGNGEVLEIYNGVKGIASHHRSDLDLLKGDVFNDVGAFIEMMADHVNQFMAAHRDQIPQANLDSMMMRMEEVHQKTNSDELKSGMGMLYDLIGEPLLLLYDGSDISSLIPSSIAAPVPGVKMAENTTLSQSFPNPASSVATIRYMLREPSSSTVLRLYDASGNTVATYDQGAQGAGEHTVDADVSKLASGTYLYHLTIQTGAGEQVFSKTLQVAR